MLSEYVLFHLNWFYFKYSYWKEKHFQNTFLWLMLCSRLDLSIFGKLLRSIQFFLHLQSYFFLKIIKEYQLFSYNCSTFFGKIIDIIGLCVLFKPLFFKNIKHPKYSESTQLCVNSTTIFLFCFWSPRLETS